MKFKTVNMIEDSEWDAMVVAEYGKPYAFQQQAGCKDRGVYEFSIPLICESWDYTNNSIPETTSTDKMGVSFRAWLDRDPVNMSYNNELWWHRNFYPDVTTIIEDLAAKGKLAPGNYLINIDW
jgi:hypothetical protein